MESNQIQVNVEGIINQLTQQIAKLSYENAMLKDLLSQYEAQQSQEKSEKYGGE